LATRVILTADKPALHIKAKPVQRVDASIRKLMADMVETMHGAAGAGLAAPQIGVSLRVIVLWHEDDEYRLVNPEITWASREIEVDEEGCLSIPGYRGNVPRAAAVKIRAKDEKGRNTQVRAEGRLARIFQHEIDHLDGMLFTERMEPGERLWRIDEWPTQMSIWLRLAPNRGSVEPSSKLTRLLIETSALRSSTTADSSASNGRRSSRPSSAAAFQRLPRSADSGTDLFSSWRISNKLRQPARRYASSTNADAWAV